MPIPSTQLMNISANQIQIHITCNRTWLHKPSNGCQHCCATAVLRRRRRRCRGCEEAVRWRFDGGAEEVRWWWCASGAAPVRRRCGAGAEAMWWRWDGGAVALRCGLKRWCADIERHVAVRGVELQVSGPSLPALAGVKWEKNYTQIHKT